MLFHSTKIKGLYVIDPELHRDTRGFFTRMFCKKEFAHMGIVFDLAQANCSHTLHKGTIRGMHFQTSPHAEDKIIQCTKGRIYDVAIDMRENSPTFGAWQAVVLTEENKKMFFVPKGFAHGFQTLIDNCVIEYLVSEFYAPEHESGVRWNDPFIGISWPIPDAVVSDKDSNLPLISLP